MSLVDEPSSRFPSGAPMERDAISRAFSTYPGSPAREPYTETPHLKPLSAISQSPR